MVKKNTREKLRRVWRRVLCLCCAAVTVVDSTSLCGADHTVTVTIRTTIHTIIETTLKLLLSNYSNDVFLQNTTTQESLRF